MTEARGRWRMSEVFDRTYNQLPGDAYADHMQDPDMCSLPTTDVTTTTSDNNGHTIKSAGWMPLFFSTLIDHRSAL